MMFRDSGYSKQLAAYGREAARTVAVIGAGTMGAGIAQAAPKQVGKQTL